MTAPLPAAFGSWKSPISADLIVAKTINLLEIHVSGSDIYWIEGRPLEAGRSVLVKRNGDSTTTDLIPEGFNARTRVHEYGGAPVLVDGETVYFSNYRDQRLYRTSSGSAPEAITPETQMRYADAVIDRARQRLICVCEDHSQEGQEARNFLGAVALDGSGTVSVLVEGNDFYSTPRLSPDGKFLTWIEWSHPNLPWDGTELWMAEVAESGEIRNRSLIAGGRAVSIVQPTWSPSGELYFVSD
ncbi:MAG TPA: S9 family peptidase, partial [Acidobacteriota bacterium]|nr:S9 family peptidase [Acidobacteriota bacterium]